MQVTKLGYWVPVNVVDGVPQCVHGDPMVETGPGEWMCPDDASFLDALRPAMARLDAMVLPID